MKHFKYIDHVLALVFLFSIVSAIVRHQYTEAWDCAVVVLLTCEVISLKGTRKVRKGEK